MLHVKKQKEIKQDHWWFLSMCFFKACLALELELWLKQTLASVQVFHSYELAGNAFLLNLSTWMFSHKSCKGWRFPPDGLPQCVSSSDYWSLPFHKRHIYKVVYYGGSFLGSFPSLSYISRQAQGNSQKSNLSMKRSFPLGQSSKHFHWKYLEA